MEDCLHGRYSILMEWLCDWPVVEQRAASIGHIRRV
jgi:hypothetical protein